MAEVTCRYCGLVVCSNEIKCPCCKKKLVAERKCINCKSLISKESKICQFCDTLQAGYVFSPLIPASDWAKDEFLRRAENCKQGGHYLGAIQNYTKVIELGGPVHANRGYVYKKLGNYVDAIEDYKQALRQNPTVPRLCMILGELYRSAHFHQAGIDFFDSIIRERLPFFDLYYAYREKGFICQEIDLMSDAELAFKSADLHRFKTNED